MDLTEFCKVGASVTTLDPPNSSPRWSWKYGSIHFFWCCRDHVGLWFRFNRLNVLCEAESGFRLAAQTPGPSRHLLDRAILFLRRRGRQKKGMLLLLHARAAAVSESSALNREPCHTGLNLHCGLGSWGFRVGRALGIQGSGTFRVGRGELSVLSPNPRRPLETRRRH